MEPKSEPMDRSIKNKSEDLKEEGSPSGKPPPVKKEEKPHPIHSFTWALVELKHTYVSCKRARTVEDSRILKNPHLKNDIGVDEMTVFAYERETVKQALRRDARLLYIVLKKKCVLSTDGLVVNKSNLVDDLGGKTYTIIMSNLSSKFENLMNWEITWDGNKKLPKTEILRVEYGKNVQTCTEVKMMKEPMGFSNSVCQVRLHDGSTGTGFLLFDRFVLTNAHVVKKVYNESLKKLSNKVIVHFSYGSLNQTEREQDSVAEVEVEEVAGFEYCPEEMYDWALLKLRAGVNLPNGLLNKCGYVNQSHDVCIIGHPDGGVKKKESCLSIAPEKRKQVVEKSRFKQKKNNKEKQGLAKNSVKLMDSSTLNANRYFKDVTKELRRHKNILTYKTSFYEGASGSPVFDKDCNVLAMHSAGYKFIDIKTNKIINVIEFGYSLSGILERIIIQLVERQRLDVLKAFLASDQTNLRKTKSNVKKLVESRNLETFKAVVRRPVADENIKELFEFFRQNEEPVPMDTC